MLATALIVTAVIWLVVGRTCGGTSGGAYDAKDRAAGNALRERVADLVGGEYVPVAAAHSRVRFAEVRGWTRTLDHHLTIVPPAAEEHGGSACLRVRSDTGRSAVETLVLNQACLPLATPLDRIVGRRRAARIPPAAAGPLLDLARTALTVSIGRTELEVCSRSSVWAWGPNASPERLAVLVRRVLATAGEIYTAPA